MSYSMLGSVESHDSKSHPVGVPFVEKKEKEMDLSLIPIHPANQLLFVVGGCSHEFDEGVEMGVVFWFDEIACGI